MCMCVSSAYSSDAMGVIGTILVSVIACYLLIIYSRGQIDLFVIVTKMVWSVLCRLCLLASIQPVKKVCSLTVFSMIICFVELEIDKMMMMMMIDKMMWPISLLPAPLPPLQCFTEIQKLYLLQVYPFVALTYCNFSCHSLCLCRCMINIPVM